VLSASRISANQHCFLKHPIRTLDKQIKEIPSWTGPTPRIAGQQ
jgi:hypothetical protein